MTKCDFCDKPSVGYVCRQLQGPFYCEEHQERAETETEQYLDYLEEEKRKWLQEDWNKHGLNAEI